MVLPDAAASLVPVLEATGQYPPGTFIQPGTVGTRLGTRVCFGLPEGSLLDLLSRPLPQMAVEPAEEEGEQKTGGGAAKEPAAAKGSLRPKGGKGAKKY
jgi:hypothetical protein